MSGWIYLGLTVVATVLAQICFKQRHVSGLKIYSLAAIALFCTAVPCTFMAARTLGIARVYVGAASSYVLAPIAAVLIFGEMLHLKQWIALILIAVGILIYSV